MVGGTGKGLGLNWVKLCVAWTGQCKGESLAWMAPASLQFSHCPIVTELVGSCWALCKQCLLEF